MTTATETFRTFCAYHLGDQLVHLNFLHRCARALSLSNGPGAVFEHAAPGHYLPELDAAVAGIDGIRLESLEVPPELRGYGPSPWAPVNAWRGSGGWWYAHPRRHDFVASHLDWFAELARRMGLPIESPIRTREDLLFEFPALSEAKGGPEQAERVEGHNIIVIDSAPQSGQLAAYDPVGLRVLADELAEANPAQKVWRTAGPDRRSLVEWGRLAAWADLIVGVATGPMWLTYHAGARHARRVWLLDHERVEICGGEGHARTVAQLRSLLFAEGWL